MLVGCDAKAVREPNACGPQPVLMLQGKVAGVAFSKLSQADNVGYIIPWKIVAHFLREYNQHGAFRGCCSVGFRWQDMENAHMRDHYKVTCRPAVSLWIPIPPQRVLGVRTFCRRYPLEYISIPCGAC